MLFISKIFPSCGDNCQYLSDALTQKTMSNECQSVQHCLNKLWCVYRNNYYISSKNMQNHIGGHGKDLHILLKRSKAQHPTVRTVWVTCETVHVRPWTCRRIQRWPGKCATKCWLWILLYQGFSEFLGIRHLNAQFFSHYTHVLLFTKQQICFPEKSKMESHNVQRTALGIKKEHKMRAS